MSSNASYKQQSRKAGYEHHVGHKQQSRSQAAEQAISSTGSFQKQHTGIFYSLTRQIDAQVRTSHSCMHSSLSLICIAPSLECQFHQSSFVFTTPGEVSTGAS